MDEDVSTADGAITCYEVSTIELAQLVWRGLKLAKGIVRAIG